MRKLTYAMLLAVIVLCGCIKDDHPTSEQTTLVKIGDRAPDFSTQLYPTGSVTLSALQDKVVLLTFWDPTCPTCRNEIAVVEQRIIDHFEDQEFQYLPIARGQDYYSIKDFFLSNGYTFAVGIDPKREIYNLYATKYVPRSFIIDRRGFIRHIFVEYELDELNTIVSSIEKMLE